MRTLNGRNREILRLPIADARRPYSDIADRVGPLGPAASDRVERLREAGVIEGFTLRIDDAALGDVDLAADCVEWGDPNRRGGVGPDRRHHLSLPLCVLSWQLRGAV